MSRGKRIYSLLTFDKASYTQFVTSVGVLDGMLCLKLVIKLYLRHVLHTIPLLLSDTTDVLSMTSITVYLLTYNVTLCMEVE